MLDKHILSVFTIKYPMKYTILLFTLFLSGCITINDINENFKKADTAWLLENQKLPEHQLKRTVNAPYEKVFSALKETFFALNMPISKQSIDKGFILSKNKAPNPLSPEQWAEVRGIENPKLSDISWMLTIAEEPEDQFVIIKASIKGDGNQSTISLDYYLEAPKLEDMGLIPMNQAPPHAVKIMTEMFWNKFNQKLKI